MKITTDNIMEDVEFEEPPNEGPDDCLTYTDESLPSSVLASMDTLRQAGQLCDCVLRVGKKLAEFTAHQAVLASVSPHFMAMFEQDPRTETRKSYNVKETNPAAFQILLDYAYTGCLRVSHANIRDVYQAANRLKFHKVLRVCAESLVNNLDIANCIETRQFIGDDPSLVESANKYIQENMCTMKETKPFLSLPQINIKLLGYSRGISGGPDSKTVANLISNWLLSLNIEDGVVADMSPLRSADPLTPSPASQWSAAAVDMQALTEHDTVLFLDADNHLQDVSNMDQSVSKTDAVQDYVKVCKKYTKSKVHNGEKSLGQNNGHSNGSAVNVIAHQQIHGTLYSLMMTIGGVVYNVVVRMQTLPKSPSTDSNLYRQSAEPSSSSGSSTDEEGKSNGLDSYYTSSLSTFKPLAEMSYPRCGVSLVSWDDKLIALGGNDRGECLSSVETYDPESNTWSELASMSSARGRFECAVLNGKLYACGGSNGRRELDSVESFDGECWAAVSKMPSSKASAGVGVLNNLLYLVGGYNGQRAEKTSEVYNPSTLTWSSIAKLNEGRSQSAVCSHRGVLYAFGGTDSWNCSSSVEVYNPATNQWKLVTHLSQARRGAAATLFKGKIYVVGGSDGSKSLDTVEIYDCETNSWTSGPPLQTPRSNAGLAVLKGRLYVVGGYGQNQFLSSMEVLEGDNDSKWCSYHKTGLPSISTDSEPDH